MTHLREVAAESPWKAFWLLVLAGFTPIPLKIFTWASGIVGVPMLPFLASMVVGRGKRVYLIAAAIRLGGERAEKALHRYIEPVGWGASALLVVGIGWLALPGARGMMPRACAIQLSPDDRGHPARRVRQQPGDPRRRRAPDAARLGTEVRRHHHRASAATRCTASPSSNGIAALDLATWNGIRPPYTIYPGQRLRLYPGGARSVHRLRDHAVARSAAHAIATGLATRRHTGAPRARHRRPPRRPASDIGWRWPADGELVGRYVAGEPTKQGIDIAGNGGAPVRAAGDGVVVYSGAGLVGYGELIIVKHNDAWLSAYGHNRARMVNEGQLVKAGQQIAEMGRTGAARDMLHFEIRYNGKPVDPLQYLPRR